MHYNKITCEYLIQLIRAVVRDETAPEKPADVKWQELLNLAIDHKAVGLAYDAMKQLKTQPQGDILAIWEKEHGKTQIVDLLQKEEAFQIINSASENKLYLLPLKGYVMKQMYPKTEYREMGDLDYLVEADRINEFRPVMKKSGYKEESVGLEASDDTYQKAPYIEVEIHRRLLPPTEENHWFTDDIWERLVPDKENPYLLHMTWEDYYLFHLLHFEKHYSMGGSGIRSILDHYYLKKNIGDKLDRDYINRNIEKMNYVQFEEMCNGLADAWFGDGKLTKELEEPAEYILNSGAFGTFEQFQKWSFERYKKEQGIKTKKGYFFRRMFMERERMEFIYPSLKKHGWLLPFFWIHRLFKSVFFNWKRVKMELDDFKKND